ncbi:LIM domain-binding protein 2 isoform X2 [Culicoides brevitarsis]|uniref:LIM domain-binding protein 2 isoform X2 n=1 Tax=Culicoides brevitarsis TaxID=469753 RepID=UPI00307BC50E
MLGISRRGVNTGPSLTLEDPAANWKGTPTGGPESQNNGNVNNFGNNANPNFSGPVFPPAGTGSPAPTGAPNYQPAPGSNTPQYTASPAPSGSSTPGPQQNVGNAGFPPPNNNAGPPFQGGPNAGGPQMSFGSPSGASTPFGRPGHFPSPGPAGPGNFAGGQFGMPPGSPFHGPGPHPMQGGMGPGQMMGGPHPVDRMDQGFNYRGMNVPRRNTYFGQPDYRIYELNRRLQQRSEQESDNCWWDSFANEFFEDDATLTLSFCLEDGPKRYTIGRTLIPRYFRSIFEGGVTELYFTMKHSKESFHNTSITLDCDQCTMVTNHIKPVYTKVCTEGRLILEFTFDDLMRIKSWHLAVRAHRELIPRSAFGMHTHQPGSDPTMLEQLSKNITRQGITNSTLNYLRLCVILEPMQELMSRHKAYALSPRDCLKTTLFQKWQRMVAPPDTQRPANKRRKRKGSNSGANAIPPVPKKRSPGPNFPLASQVTDVMVVGEPSLMGGEFGDEDERLITRLENTQYDATAALDSEGHTNFGHADSPMTGGPGPSWQMDRSGNGVGGSAGPSSQDSEKKSPNVSQ